MFPFCLFYQFEPPGLDLSLQLFGDHHVSLFTYFCLSFSCYHSLSHMTTFPVTICGLLPSFVHFSYHAHMIYLSVTGPLFPSDSAYFYMDLLPFMSCDLYPLLCLSCRHPSRSTTDSRHSWRAGTCTDWCRKEVGPSPSATNIINYTHSTSLSLNSVFDWSMHTKIIIVMF